MKPTSYKSINDSCARERLKSVSDMEPLRIYIISNFYPNEDQNDYYGVFVKNFIVSLSRDKEITFSCSSLIKGRGKNNFDKLIKYVRFYFDILIKGFFAKYDLIYVHNVSHTAIPLMIVNLIRKKGIVLNPHGEDIITTAKHTDILLRLSTPLIRRSKIVVPSKFFKKYMINRFDKSEKDVFVYPSGGIDTKLFSPADKPLTSYTCIGFVSRLDAWKGWDTYLLAIKALVGRKIPVKAIVAGRGDQSVEFLHMINELELADYIDYRGGMNQEALISLYRQMDIFVFPTEFQESLGLVGLEAMACGIPVVGSKIGGLEDYIVEDYNGYFIKPRDFVMLAEKLTSFIHLDSEKKKILSQNARATALGYDAVDSTKRLTKQLKNWHNFNNL